MQCPCKTNTTFDPAKHGLQQGTQGGRFLAAETATKSRLCGEKVVTHASLWAPGCLQQESSKNKEAEESPDFKHLLSTQHKDRQEKSLPREHLAVPVYFHLSLTNAYLESITIQPLVCTCCGPWSSSIASSLMQESLLMGMQWWHSWNDWRFLAVHERFLLVSPHKSLWSF